MPNSPHRGADVPMPKRNNAYLGLGLLLLLVIVVIEVAPHRIPGLFGMAGSDVHQFLTLRLFSLGQVSVSILSLLKAALFLLLLSTIITRVRHQIYVQLRRTAMGDSRAY